MKTIIKISTAILCIVLAGEGYAQNINWASLKAEDRHLLNLNIGFEHGLIYGAEYGYHINSIFPIVLNVEYSFPSGDNIIDDFKSKIGARVRLIKAGDFHFSANIHGLYRRYENNLVRMQNFGSDFSGIAGIFRQHWFIAAEAGFDKAIVTHLKHSGYYREIYPKVKNGWFEPATGGNFYYGIQAGISFKQHDIYIKADRLLVQDFRSKPTVPYIAEIGYNLRIKTRNY